MTKEQKLNYESLKLKTLESIDSILFDLCFFEASKKMRSLEVESMIRQAKQMSLNLMAK